MSFKNRLRLFSAPGDGETRWLCVGHGWYFSGGHDLARHLPDRIRAGGGLVADVPVHTLTRLLLIQKFVARPLKILSSDHDLS